MCGRYFRWYRNAREAFYKQTSERNVSVSVHVCEHAHALQPSKIAFSTFIKFPQILVFLRSTSSLSYYVYVNEKKWVLRCCGKNPSRNLLRDTRSVEPFQTSFDGFLFYHSTAEDALGVEKTLLILRRKVAKRSICKPYALFGRLIRDRKTLISS